MKIEKKWYFMLVLFITVLIFKQYWGLNALLISIISVIYIKYFSKSKKTTQWWLSAVLWIGSGCSICLSHTYIGGVLYFITALNFFAQSFNHKFSFPYTILHSLFSFFIGIAKFLTPPIKENPLSENENAKKETIESKSLKKVLLFGIPTFLIFIFLKLYQFANPKFAEYTEFINLKFLNWEFILLYIALMIILYGLYIFNRFEVSEDWDLNTLNDINLNYDDKIQHKIGVETEQKVAILTLSTLNFLLVSFLIIDGITLFNPSIHSELSHSENVHQGINILITSIILVIFIVGYIFRGGLNFIQSKSVKILSTIWLFLNIIITFFNGIKNYHYIYEWGLTHKRVGVYTYLMLCIIGLIFTLYKIWNQKSFAYLVRSVMLSSTSFLVIFSIFNWNYIIAKYNLNDSHFPKSKIDFYYNLDLGYEAYPALLTYFEKHPDSDRNIYEMLDYRILNHTSRFNNNWKNFPSIKWSELQAEKELEDYQPLEINNFQPYRSQN